MKNMVEKKSLAIRTAVCFFVVCVITSVCYYFINQYQEKEAKLKASYTAESTIRKVETQLGRYLEDSSLFENILSSGYTISDEQFEDLSGFMIKDKDVIEAYELAPKGIVSQIYPYEENKEAVGLNLLESPDRKTEAALAKHSHKYTIAGPYELKQGGMGALLIDPIYLDDAESDDFWGYSLLVLDWEKFLQELQIDKLSDAGYHFDVWKVDMSGNHIDIMNCGHGEYEDALRVPCSVPNDTWYFEIMPRTGWVPVRIKMFGYVLSVLTGILAAIWYWQSGMKKIREKAYAGELEKSAKHAKDANEAKTRFLFNMSHDIRTPMNAIVGYSELLEESIDDKETALGYLSKIKASSSMLLSLINYILEMARIESGKLALREERVNLKEIVEILKTVSQTQIEEKKLSASWNIDVTHENVLTDNTKLQEIVLNIVSNAIKYTHEGGRIDLNVKELEAEKESYASYSIIVEDTGIGMHESFLPHIFEEFTRERTSTESKTFGVGLGLPIVKSLVDMMNGHIEVESKINVGTKFTIYLSFQIAPDTVVEEKHVLHDGKHINLAGKKVLIVEDNELNAEIAKEILTREKMIVDTAEDGSKCIECLDEKSANYYDLILMDIQMPVMNGYDTTRVIRNSNKPYANIPIIATTANAFEEDKEQALKVGMNAHVAKPVDVDRLIEVLSDILEEKEDDK